MPVAQKTAPKLRSLPKRNTKEVILEAATRLASTHGIEGLTIGELAKTVGMSKSGLFAHFKGKDDLQLRVLQSAVEKFVDVVLREAFRSPRGAPRVKALYENWIRHLNSDEDLPGGSILISVSLELDDRPGQLRDYVQKVQKDLIANIEKAAQLAIDEGHFRRDVDVGLFAWTLYSFVLGFHHFKRMVEDPRAEKHLHQSLKELMLAAQIE